jgi:RNA polymerase-binding transcription factor DksA
MSTDPMTTDPLTIDGPIQVTPTGPAADEAALTEASRELDAVEAALVRLEDGSFDRCDVCGQPIGRDRLQEDPLLTRCPAHT